MNYREIVLPGGTFRMFDNEPGVWKQVLRPGEKSVVEQIEDAYASGNLKAGAKK